MSVLVEYRVPVLVELSGDGAVARVIVEDEEAAATGRAFERIGDGVLEVASDHVARLAAKCEATDWPAWELGG